MATPVTNVPDTNAFGAYGSVGVIANADFTPAAAAYGAGDIMDTAKQFSWIDNNGIAVPAGALIRVLSSAIKIGITSVPSGQTSYSLQKFSITPPSVQADNALFTTLAANQSAYRGPISLGTPVLPSVGSEFLYIKSQYIDTEIKLGAGLSSSWGQLITDGAHTATAVARQVILYGVLL